jgi:hypothetical protein
MHCAYFRQFIVCSRPASVRVDLSTGCNKSTRDALSVPLNADRLLTWRHPLSAALWAGHKQMGVAAVKNRVNRHLNSRA